MGIDDFLVALLLVAGFAASALQKLVQRSKAKRQMTNEERVGESRRLAEQNLRTAQRRGAAQHPAPAPAQPKSAKIEDVIRRLMGEETGSPLEGPAAGSDETDEEDWRPLAPPPIRRAPPTPQPQPVQRVPATPPRQLHQQPPRRQAQMPQRPAPPPPSARPERQRPARTPAEMIAQPRRRTAEELTHEEIEQREAEELTHEEIEQRENERRWHEEMEQRKKQQAAQQAQQAKQRSPEVLHSRARLQSARRRLFHSASEVRRAFILSEVLGPPRAMRDLEERT